MNSIDRTRDKEFKTFWALASRTYLFHTLRLTRLLFLWNNPCIFEQSVGMIEIRTQSKLYVSIKQSSNISNACTIAETVDRRGTLRYNLEYN